MRCSTGSPGISSAALIRDRSAPLQLRLKSWSVVNSSVPARTARERSAAPAGPSPVPTHLPWHFQPPVAKTQTHALTTSKSFIQSGCASKGFCGLVRPGVLGYNLVALVLEHPVPMVTFWLRSCLLCFAMLHFHMPYVYCSGSIPYQSDMFISRNNAQRIYVYLAPSRLHCIKGTYGLARACPLHSS